MFAATKVPASHVCNIALAVETQYGRSSSDALTSGLAKTAATKNPARDSHKLLVNLKLKADRKSVVGKECW